MKAPLVKPNVKLAGEDGNAYAIMGRVTTALRLAGADTEYVDKYHREAMSGNYDHLLQVSMEYINAE